METVFHEWAGADVMFAIAILVALVALSLASDMGYKLAMPENTKRGMGIGFPETVPLILRLFNIFNCCDIL